MRNGGNWREISPLRMEGPALCIHIIDFGIKINSVIWYFAQIPLGLPSTFFLFSGSILLNDTFFNVYFAPASCRCLPFLVPLSSRRPSPACLEARDRNVWGNNVITIPLHSRHGYIHLCPRSFLVGEWLNHITTMRSADLKFEFIFTEKLKESWSETAFLQRNRADIWQTCPRWAFLFHSIHLRINYHKTQFRI